MQVEVSPAEPGALGVDVLGMPVSQPADAARLPADLRARLAPLIDSGEATGALGSAPLLHANGERPARIVAAGVGATPDADAIRTAAAAVARAAGAFGGTVGWIVDASLGVPAAEQARAAVEGVAFGSYSPGRWKSDGTSRREITRVVLLGPDDVAPAAERAAAVARWIDVARDLSNAPPNELWPETLAARARDLAGKAITFDAGGISLKPALGMESMKGDMSGGAAVLAGAAAVAELGLPIRVLTVIAAAENMPGGNAFRPGDIVRAANGKTIEITNTDAEGRLVLADALWYAREQGATHVVDFATLTGAMVVALGDLYAGFFANDDEWAGQLLRAAETSGDHLWRLPLHPRYRRYVDSTFADLKNSSTHREASPVLAAEFLREFAGEGPWAHLDIAGPAYLERSRGDYLTQRGGTGYGVRLIAELAQGLAT